MWGKVIARRKCAYICSLINLHCSVRSLDRSPQAFVPGWRKKAAWRRCLRGGGGCCPAPPT